MIELESCLK